MNRPTSWPALGAGEVHVWLASLDVPASVLQRLAPTLTPDEAERAQRFHFERHRHHFTAARGILRHLLGQYLDLPPTELRFRYSAAGKPALATESVGENLSFNLAHSQQWALYGVTRGRRLGVDLEWMDEKLEVESIARAYFSPRENAALCSLDGPLRRQTFFRLWTHKEAMLKALGEGLGIALNQVEVAVEPGVPPRLLHLGVEREDAARWSFHDLAAPPGYAAALAVEAAACHLRHFTWDAG